jgi:hypothetical protein
VQVDLTPAAHERLGGEAADVESVEVGQEQHVQRRGLGPWVGVALDNVETVRVGEHDVAALDVGGDVLVPAASNAVRSAAIGTLRGPPTLIPRNRATEIGHGRLFEANPRLNPMSTLVTVSSSAVSATVGEAPL